MSDPTTEYTSSHTALKNDSGRWDLDTLYDNSIYVNFEWTDSSGNTYIDIEDIIIDVFKITSGPNGQQLTKIFVSEDDGIEINTIGWDESTGLFSALYNISNDFSYEMRVYYRFSSPYKPTRVKLLKDSSSSPKKISVPSRARFVVYNTPVPPPPPT